MSEMVKHLSPPSHLSFEACVAAFEAARATDAAASLREAALPPDHPDYARAVCELVRIDMEMGWEQGHPRGINEYCREFPEVFRDLEALGAIAFEEYRQRREHGETPSPREYQGRYGVDTSGWPRPELSDFAVVDDRLGASTERTQHVEPDFAVEKAARAYEELSRRLEESTDGEQFSIDVAMQVPQTAAELFLEAHRADPARARNLAKAVTSLPEVGSDFLDFRLVEELGRGAFGRVFLAEQKGLANRFVALKVSTQLFDESQTLAQLQHTNIVPIYSAHQHGPIQALCMPYFGSITLADVSRDLRCRAELPVSGNHLVSTLQNRKSTVRSLPGSSIARPHSAGQDVAESETARGHAPAGQGGALPITDALVKMKNFGYVEAVLWMGGRLADALSHAHERGICHRDLKPANVLLTDEGQPMILDFNLSDDQKLRGGLAAARIGGTLPYMAPEQLESFRDQKNRVDPRSDLYSLGLILYELLTGHHAYPNLAGSIRSVLPRLIENRHKPVPPMRPWNPHVSPAVESIVRRCLEHDPDRRYQSAQELREDIERHLAHWPLKHAPEPSLAERAGKFRRRHPHITSSATMLTLSAVVVLGLTGALVAAQQRYARLDALDVRARSADEIQQAKFLLYKLEPDRNQLEDGMARCQIILATYPVVDLEALRRDEVRENPAWDQVPAVRNLPSADDRQRLGEELGEVLLMYVRGAALDADQERDPDRRKARAEFGLKLCDLAERRLGESRATQLHRLRLTKALGKLDAARELARKAEDIPVRTARDNYLVGLFHLDRKEFDRARKHFQEATRLGPQNFLAWFNLGLCHAEEMRLDEAADCFTACLALAPKASDAFYPYVNRGLVYLRASKHAAAREDLTEALRLRPDAHEALVQRGVATKEMGEGALRLQREEEAARLFCEAESDFTKALDQDSGLTQVYFLRAAVRDKSGKKQAADQDRRAGDRIEPHDVASWIDRGYARLAKTDPESTKAALADFEQALKLNPRSAAALQDKAHVLSERMGKTAEAVQVLDKALELYPGYVMARLGRGVLLARLGQRERAVADARIALRSSKSPATFYQASNIFALTSKQNPEDRLEAYPLMSLALRGGFGLDIIDQDSDMDPIRNTPEFRALVQAARQLQPK
jgi:serine/threonine protein kinase/tetratricopeptide (TPR) repeat protein